MERKGRWNVFGAIDKISSDDRNYVQARTMTRACATYRQFYFSAAFRRATLSFFFFLFARYVQYNVVNNRVPRGGYRDTKRT